MQTRFTLLPALLFCALLHGQSAQFPPLPDTCFDLFVFHVPNVQTEAALAKFTRQLDSLMAAPRPDTLALAIVHRRLAVLNIILSKPVSSVQYANSSLRLIKQLSPVPEAERSKSLQACANAYILSYQYDSALLVLDTAMYLNRRLYGEVSMALGINYQSKGRVYNSISRFKEAAECLDKAIEIESKASAVPNLCLANAIYVRAIVYSNVDEFETSFQVLKEAEKILLQTLDRGHPAFATIYLLRAANLMFTNDIDNSMSYLQRCFTIWERSLGPLHGETGRACYYLGELYFNIGDYPNAVFYKERSYEIEKLRTGGKPGPDKAGGMVALYANGGDYEKEAIVFEYMMQLEGFGSFGTANEFYRIAYCNHAIALIGQNRNEEAIGWIDKSCEVSRQINPDRPELNYGAELLKARALLKLRRFDEAIVICETLRKAEPSPGYQRVSKAAMAAIFFEKYKQQHQLPDLENAWQNYLSSIRLIDSLRFTYQPPASRIWQNELNFHEFEVALEICKERQEAATAFWVAEKSKAQALLENHRDDLARRIAGLPDSLLRLETELKSQIATLETTAHHAPPGNERMAAEERLFEKKQSLNHLLTSLEQDYPDYYRLKYSTSLANAAEVQARLPEATALLEYFVGDSSIFVFALTKDTLQFSSLPTPTDLEATVLDLRKALTDSELRFSKKDASLFAAASGKLYDWLLATPIAALQTGIEHLVVVPDGALSYLPFEILGKNEGQADFKSYPYLLKKFSVSYAISANLLMEQTGQLAVSSGQSAVGSRQWAVGGEQLAEPLELFAGFAPSYADADTLNVLASRVRALLVRDDKYDLPGAALEVQEIADLLGGKTWLGEAATEANFKQASPQYRILHLAMHSIMDDANPLFSKLLFTNTELPNAELPNAEYGIRNTELLPLTEDPAVHGDNSALRIPHSAFGNSAFEEDNDLNANELYTMRLPARLVVLSACNTGAGKLRRGEGVMSLSRAFMYAGVPATVMSLWQAPDETTRQVMTGFYSNLKKGMRKDEALRQAKLAHLSTCDAASVSPFFWAGFVANGDMGALFGRE